MIVKKIYCDKCNKEIVPPDVDCQIQVTTFRETKTFDYCGDCVKKIFDMRAK